MGQISLDDDPLHLFPMSVVVVCPQIQYREVCEFFVQLNICRVCVFLLCRVLSGIWDVWSGLNFP